VGIIWKQENRDIYNERTKSCTKEKKKKGIAWPKHHPTPDRTGLLP
jgi:hypothetical protein